MKKIHVNWYLVLPNVLAALIALFSALGPWLILEYIGKALVFCVWFVLAVSAVLALGASVVAVIIPPLYNVVSQLYFGWKVELSFKSGELGYSAILLICGLFVANISSILTWGTPDFAVMLSFDTLWQIMKPVYVGALIISFALCFLEVFPLARLRDRLRVMLDRRALG